MKHFYVILLLLISTIPVYADNWYVDGAKSADTGDGTSWETAKQYIQSGIALMSAGDTLTIRDGTYTGTSNCMYYYGGIPSGNNNGTPNDPSDDIYTTIQAENDFGVLIDGEGINHTWWVGVSAHETSYVQFIGLKFTKSSSTNVFLYHCDHIKFLRCASYETGVDDGGSENQMNFSSDTASCSYLLFEDCIAWGAGRYKFEISAPNSILRRCIARPDYHSTPDGQAGWPQAGISFYSSSNCAAQNVIVLDGLFTCTGHYQYGFGIANGGLNTQFVGSISLNNAFEGVRFEAEGIHLTNIQVDNCVIWDVVGRGIINGEYPGGTTYIDSTTIGEVAVKPGGEGYGIGYSYAYVNNSIITGSATNGLREVTSTDYNSLYNNGINYQSCTPGTHDITAVNPLAGSPASLTYLTQIETGSSLEGQGENGQDIGATIIKQMGKSGSLYGEPGWDKLQDGTDGQVDANLWPWPYEDKIKDLMSVYNLHSVDGTRGFCASTANSRTDTGEITLTSYIWEYLGNQIPSDIYNLGNEHKNVSIGKPLKIGSKRIVFE